VVGARCARPWRCDSEHERGRSGGCLWWRRVERADEAALVLGGGRFARWCPADRYLSPGMEQECLSLGIEPVAPGASTDAGVLGV
jgi:hypothetical protein